MTGGGIQAENMDVPGADTVRGVISRHAASTPDAIALGAPERSGMTYVMLLSQIDATGRTLRSLGIGRNDRVAIVLPNGPEMAAAFAAVSSYATAAPLNPAYREAEYEFYLSDLDAKALIIAHGMESDARKVARARGVMVVELSPREQAAAGAFSLAAEAAADESLDGPAEADDVALVLHTSGTTSRPKMVPLTHLNICTSGANVSRALSLTPKDRCLNIMPLFHIHGLIGALLSSLWTGAQVICTPGFLAPRFFEWMDECAPTWYTAVPTMHQAILQRARANTGIIERNPLRLIRSSSSSMPPQVMAELERAFNAPLIESYGMTEASHQMASNPLPPAVRKPGSVGVASGPDVAVMDAAGSLLERGKTGEIVIRGANVTRGYVANPKANADAFTGGWFRTGDEGYFDEDDYLFLTGRLKEIINRAGEKISPREVDEVLLDHAAVAQVVTFAVPDERLGEEIGVALVLKEGASATETEIREYAAWRLADFKVPRHVVFLKEIPKGPTGKLQRIGLAEKLGLTGEKAAQTQQKAEYVAARTPTEEKLATIWAAELGLERVGVRDNFFDLGGYSLLAARIFQEIGTVFGKVLPVVVLVEAPTIEKLAAVLESEAGEAYPSIVALEKGGGRLPFFCMANADAVVFVNLARLVGTDQTFYGLHPQGLVPANSSVADIDALASRYVELIRNVQPEGPYLLGGKCASGYVAYEAARQLRQAGQEVALLVLMDVPGPWNALDWLLYLKRRIVRFADHMWDHARNLWRLAGHERSAYLKKGFGRLSGRLSPGPRGTALSASTPVSRVIWRALKNARARHKPGPYDGPIVIFNTPERERREGSGHAIRWKKLAKGGCVVYEVQSVHEEMLHEPHVRFVAERLRACFDKIAAEGGRSGAR